MNQTMSAISAAKELTKRLPGAMIAGGYLRDAVVGNTPKDIDVFVPCEAPVREVIQSLETYGWTLKNPGDTNASAPNERGLLEVLQLENTAESTLNIDVVVVACGTPEYIRNFTMSSSKVWLKDDGTLGFSKDFAELPINNRIYDYRPAGMYPEYKKRMHAKFPNATFIRRPYGP